MADSIITDDTELSIISSEHECASSSDITSTYTDDTCIIDSDTITSTDTSDFPFILERSSPAPTVKESLWTAGWLAIKRNLYPGLVLQSFAILIVILYYTSSTMETAFTRLGVLRDEAGIWFSIISTSICGGVIPQIVITARKCECTIYNVVIGFSCLRGVA